LFRSIFRRGASVAHPSTNRRGGALTRQARFDGNDKASAVIFDFLRGVPARHRRKSARARARVRFLESPVEFVAPADPRDSAERERRRDGRASSFRDARLTRSPMHKKRASERAGDPKQPAV